MTGKAMIPVRKRQFQVKQFRKHLTFDPPSSFVLYFINSCSECIFNRVHFLLSYPEILLLPFGTLMLRRYESSLKLFKITSQSWSMHVSPGILPFLFLAYFLLSGANLGADCFIWHLDICSLALFLIQKLLCLIFC